ncbi:MFS transporter [Pedobacter aquatilis]|uniref:MFS transporter n=1 Tax=Pedobacter aquatilis TaxID=351343 RepID=UPI0025B39712|nr:MFS transporter [Pedobacter aquatilis]MDN3588654.1 MFS transporter [Pedobacter aquatilis]
MKHISIRLRHIIQEYIPLIACMIIMFQAYLIAPLGLTLSKELNSTSTDFGIPGFAIAFSIAAVSVAYIKLNLRIRVYLLMGFGAMALGNYLLSHVHSAGTFLLIRTMIGFGTGALLPMVILNYVCHTQKSKSLERIVPVIFAIAIGMTFSPSFGGWLNGIFGWRVLYQYLSMLCATLFVICLLSKSRNFRSVYLPQNKSNNVKAEDRTAGYIYCFTFLTGIFHSGVFVWISHYFTLQYGLSEFEIATELFIFGVPGFALSFTMHYFELDKKTTTILYAAMGVTISGLMLLWVNLPLGMAECLLAIISMGFGCSQPLFVGLIKIPQAGESLLTPAALGAGFLFGGYGSGPVIMFALLAFDISSGLLFLILTVIALAYISRRVWKKSSETDRSVLLSGE